MGFRRRLCFILLLVIFWELRDPSTNFIRTCFSEIHNQEMSLQSDSNPIIDFNHQSRQPSKDDHGKSGRDDSNVHSSVLAFYYFLNCSLVISTLNDNSHKKIVAQFDPPIFQPPKI
ncbi:MAG: hypothetical protein IT289_02300 [Oligoflexia bacterium]|nr:hypothetical protein [Oligoflexia bacterium]